ncbi:hypothetical protein [Streptomyces sp. NPDC087862]|uniref:hypothetical protein n=1 Tax=Streptomyces sp. NPDC087862 TaxID=3365813 RepID=UPI0037FD5ABB
MGRFSKHKKSTEASTSTPDPVYKLPPLTAPDQRPRWLQLQEAEAAEAPKKRWRRK